MTSSRSNAIGRFLVLFCAVALIRAQTPTTTEICDQYIDLVFAIDASGSVKEEGYQQIKQFTKEIIKSFQIGPSKTHVGVVTFSEYAELQVKLTDTFDKQDLLDRVDNLDYPGYRTALDDALRVVNSAMFSLDGGARQGVPQVLIFLTDGKCTVCTDDLQTVVTPLKDAGVTIYTVGITNNINRTELEIISSDPSQKYMFEVETFSDLKGIIQKLNQKTCVVKKGKCAKPLPPFTCPQNQEDECNGDETCGKGPKKCCFNGCIHKCQFPLANCLSSIDIAFALDSSRSVRDDTFVQMKKFANDIVDSFQVSQQDARFASLIFGSNTEVNFNFVRYDTAKEVKRAIDGLVHQKSSTDIHSALEKVRSDIFSLQGKVRTRRPMVLIVFYDGDVRSGTKDLAEVVAPLKAYGVKVVAIGVGPEVNTYQLNKIAQSSNTVFQARTFDVLLPELYSIAKESCTEKPGECVAEEDAPSEEECAGRTGDDECDNDFDCFGNSKCCKSGCFNKCVLPVEKCKRKVDIAFAIHQNLEANDHDMTKYFLRSSIDHFNIGKDQSHAALLTFGYDNKVVFDFNTDQDAELNLKPQINELPFIPGKGRLVDVLKMACDNIFCAAGGTRNNVPKMLVIVTAEFDESDPNELQERIKILRSRGVDVVIIGVGAVDPKILQQITSDKPGVDNQVLLTKYFNGVLQYVQDIADFACGEAGSILPPPPAGGLTEGGNQVCGAAKIKGCLKGPKGSRGRPGNYGGRGAPGPRGPLGSAGLAGKQGPRGDPGLNGMVGERGPKGLIGLPGFPGFDGIPGVPGVEGRQGEMGGCGLPGQPGEAGKAGLGGFTGVSGRKGPSGTKGRKGEPAPDNPDLEILPGDDGDPGEGGDGGFKGQKGEIGMLGMIGDDGVDGSEGPKGFMGEMGDEGVVTLEKGPKGFTGDRGEAGSPGVAEATSGELLQGPEGSSGPKGEPGMKGQVGQNSDVKGIQGERGEQGFIGQTGVEGGPGPAGEKGPSGELGFQGKKGQQGEAGMDGLTGEKGQQGEPGFEQGAPGPKGKRGNPAEPTSDASPKGAKGPLGDDGDPGPNGAIGAEGEEGPKGERGMSKMGNSGDDGAVGPRGPQGKNGMQGEAGMGGLRGPKGIKGDIGAKGDTGRNAKAISGDPGMDGPPGQKGVFGSLGNPGEVGPRGPTMQLEQNCIENVCPQNRKGDPGQQGDTGPIGPAGEKGVNGSKGYPGGPCPTCPSGDDGISGDFGEPGKVGEKGELGSAGDPGPAGVKGQRGEKGPSGFRGEGGIKGLQGDAGDVGGKGPDALGESLAEEGDKGPPGSDGINGTRGADGPKGLPGKKGELGEQGKRGENGLKGESGPAGNKGQPGLGGSKGEKGDQGEDSRGLTGEGGELGPEGRQGAVGEVGLKGRKGEAGEEPTEEEKEAMKNKMAGDEGVRGADGEPGEPGRNSTTPGERGPRGPKGKMGTVGPKGYGGIKGDNGFNGRSGEDGDPGPAGFPGKNGPRGQSGEPGKAGKEGIAPKGQKGETGGQGPNGERGPDAPPPPGCFNFGDAADVGFIMDSSKSVNEADFNRQKEFIDQILQQFNIGPKQTQAAVIKYGRTASVEINFDDFYTYPSLKNKIDNIEYDSARESRLDLALKLARDDMFTRRRGARIDDPKVEQALVILGDGFISGGGGSRRQLMEDAREYAQDLKKEGILVFTLAVGVEKNIFLLKEIASKDTYYLEVQSYTELIRRIGLLKDNLAQGCTVEGEPGKDGVTGEPGNTGEPGEPGKPGEGEPGRDGLKGLKGFPGEPGDQVAAKGEPGMKGVKGMKGPDGFDGLQGSRGLGNQGRKGEKGDRADDLKGFKGTRGEQGPLGPVGPAGQDFCDSVLATDILFILDTSSGVGIDNFNKMKQFLDEIVNSFDIDNQLTRVGVITFDEEARYDIKLNAFNTQRDLLDGIEELAYANGKATRIDKALLLASSQGFAEVNGARSGVNKAMVIMTDGQSSYHPEETPISEAVQPLIDDRVLRYAIGIGPEISPVELASIAGKNVLLATDFDALLGKIEDQLGLIGRGGCKGDPGLPGKSGEKGDSGFIGTIGSSGEDGAEGPEGPKGLKGNKGEQGSTFGVGGKGDKGSVGDEGPIGLPGCTEEQRPTPTDLGFMIDASASLYDYGFKNELDFVTDIIDKVGPISSGGLRAGVVVYSDKANSRIYMNDHFNTDDFKFAVKELPYDNRGQTRIDLGFEESKNLFKVENGARPSSKKVLILMTDGQQTYVPGVKEPSEIAKELHVDGVDVYSIGIGEEIDRVELESFISKKEYIFLASDLKQLLNVLVKEITQALTCEGGPRGPSGRPGGDGPPGDQGPVGSIGNTGRKGDQGDPGFGPKGEPGEAGGEGFPGRDGEKGFRGRDGTVGPRGPIGDKGSEGPSGPKGGMGEDGFIGFNGLEGPPGPKGQRGDAVDEGQKGLKGEPGEPGLKGPRGDQGSLPPGNTLKDLRGEEGNQGPAGGEGGEGPEGGLKVAPGPLGLAGEKGEKGVAGDFGERGPIGPLGPNGFKGEEGPTGEKGDSGSPGFFGKIGEQGVTGDGGEPGVSLKGEPGVPGEPGSVGDLGPEGEVGLRGFYGMEGGKGEVGEIGPPGRQQLPEEGKDQEMKGRVGEKGFSGDFGPDGEPGEPGILLERQGEFGSKGLKGAQGPEGATGERGIGGLIGMIGKDGLKGRTGLDGDPGAAGPKGAEGEMGPVIGGGEKGDFGGLGDVGLTGRPGLKGVKGFIGDIGPKGDLGIKGGQGDSGFPGMIGDQGPPGGVGTPGPQGEEGPLGLEGPGGPAGPMGSAKNFGHNIVRHSQNSFVPSCPRDYMVLWEGYSLMYTVGNGYAHSQDLGDAGSCSRSFSTLPFLFCSLTGTCQYASRNDFTYWLAGDVQQPMMPVTNDAIEPFISRCVVCKAPDINMAVHSQDVVLPSCPVGYESLWSGFSFMMVAAAGNTGSGQSLGSSGSCLEEFRPKPFIECQGARGTCHFFSDKFSFWLTTIDPSRQFEIPTPQTLIETKGDDLSSRVSRCRVCLRSSTSGGGIFPEGSNNNNGNTFSRLARSVKKWMVGGN